MRLFDPSEIQRDFPGVLHGEQVAQAVKGAAEHPAGVSDARNAGLVRSVPPLGASGSFRF